jgi:hypothetical protein
LTGLEVDLDRQLVFYSCLNSRNGESDLTLPGSLFPCAA